MSSLFTPIDQVIKEFFATKPKEVDGVFNSSCMYYQKYLLELIFGRFEITGMPDWWDKDYVLENLFIDGLLCITETEYGITPLRTGIAGQDLFMHPTECVISNSVIGSFRKLIGTECALVKISFTYRGISRMLARYSYMLASCDSSICVNLMNSKVTSVFEVEDKKQAEESKLMYDKISMGEPAVFVNKRLNTGNNVTYLPAKQNYIADMVQDTKRTIINEFLTEWGINNANTDKKERLVSAEVNSNNEEINVHVQSVLDNVNEGFAVANALYGLSLNMKTRKWGADNVRTVADTTAVSGNVG